MSKKRIAAGFLRLLCAAIDYLLLMLPVQLVMFGIMGVGAGSVDFLFRLLFAVYGVVMIEYFHGATVGKYLGKLMVVDRTGGKAPMLYVGLRELVRSMYLIPVAGWIFGLISTVMLFWRGQTLHDLAGRTAVILRRQYEEAPEEGEA